MKYKPGDSVIIFFSCGSDPSDISPVLGYIADKENVYGDLVYVNTDLQQAIAGYGISVNVNRVRTYTDELWVQLQEINRLERKIAELCQSARNAIRFGKAVTIGGDVTLSVTEKNQPEQSQQMDKN